jgi:hypothetical protein
MPHYALSELELKDGKSWYSELIEEKGPSA